MIEVKLSPQESWFLNMECISSYKICTNFKGGNLKQLNNIYSQKYFSNCESAPHVIKENGHFLYLDKLYVRIWWGHLILKVRSVLDTSDTDQCTCSI